MSDSAAVTVVGGGLAGSEAAWQLAERGASVRLIEMRPGRQTGAHQTEDLAELVCSNSLGSRLPDRASGMLMAELRTLGSMLLQVAESVQVPAGGALAVDRQAFAQAVTDRIASHPRIAIERREAEELPQPVAVIASGPLTSSKLAKAIARSAGEDHLYFYDALSPIVEVDSIDFDRAFRGSRYGRGELEAGDYINCPLDQDEYKQFVEALRTAERIPLRAFEQEVARGVRAGMHEYFEGCLPIEVIAARGERSLAFGPMRPVGLTDPATGRRPYALVQLRQDDLAGQLYNMVGFQTNLRFPEQRRVLRMIPGLEQARFARYGQMHRNTFINAPNLLTDGLAFRPSPGLYFAGQITGIEGYLGNIASGLVAGVNAARALSGAPDWQLPRTTMLGALLHYVSHAEPKSFQPMKANLGLLPQLPAKPKRNRRQRAAAHAQRGRQALQRFVLRQSPKLRIAT